MPENIEAIRHSLAHVLAQAVNSLHKKVLFGIGPNIDNGFYYDFDNLTITQEDLKKIEDKMKEIIKAKIPIKKIQITKKDAEKRLKGQKYKLDLLKDLEDKEITFYEQGDFSDLCKGPHVKNTGDIPIDAFKLTHLAGAYWKGDSKKKMLTRIYGLAFSTKDELNNYIKLKEEAEKRDHIKLGKELDLLYFHEFAPGAPFYLKNGTIIYNILIDFIRTEYKKRGYEEVITPQLYNKKLWEISGHWEHYKENMFIVNIEGQEHSLKPMNCPSHCLIYNRDIKSYRQLPIRIADFCNLHRNELSGTLSGLFRVRKFAQDDGHIFCTFDQIESEVLDVLKFIKYVWEDVFNFKLKYYLSTKPEKALGTKELWDKAEDILAKALKKADIKYEIKEGDGAFYGPKIDIDIEDALGRKWQCPTCQLDFNLPERFNTEYEGPDGKKHKAVMIHRAVLGSLERFIGILIEHYAGKLPLWLSPVQVIILPITDRNMEYAKEIKEKLFSKDIRVEIDTRSESISKKVRDAQMKKINIMITVGDKEVENKTLAIRTLDGKVEFGVKIDNLVEDLLNKIKNKN